MSQPTNQPTVDIDIQPIDDIVIIHEMLWTIRTNLIDIIQNRLNGLVSQYFRDLSGGFTGAVNVIKRSIASWKSMA